MDSNNKPNKCEKCNKPFFNKNSFEWTSKSIPLFGVLWAHMSLKTILTFTTEIASGFLACKRLFSLMNWVKMSLELGWLLKFVTTDRALQRAKHRIRLGGFLVIIHWIKTFFSHVLIVMSNVIFLIIIWLSLDYKWF